MRFLLRDMKNKGLSSVITQVLIILVAIVSIGIVWIGVRAIIGSLGDGENNNQLGCVGLSLEPTMCANLSGGRYQVGVIHGADSRNLSDIVFVFTNGSISTTLRMADAISGRIPGQLEGGSFVFNLSSWGVANRVDVAGVLSGGICAPSGTPVSCGTVTDNGNCNDEEDNDNDGATDSDDFSCQRGGPNEDTSVAKCQDGIDNDEDGWIDFGSGATNDPGCDSLQDNDERNVPTTPPSWEKLNDGQPIDAGRGLRNMIYSNHESEVLTHKDNSGNVLYFFGEEDTNSLQLGRFNAVSKTWELFSFNGWSSNSADIARPFSESLWFEMRVKLFNIGNTIIGMFSAAPRSGAVRLDVHGSMYGVKFDNQDVKYWANSTDYISDNANALAYSYPGAGGYYSDFDMNSNEGIAVGQIGQFNQYYIGASRLDAATGEWRNWYNGEWSMEFTNDIFPLPFITEPASLLGSIVISNVASTRDFIITYVYREGSIDYTLRAAKYNDQQKKGFSWR